MVIQAKVFFVSLAHRYWHTLWSPEENRKVYGALASAQGVGSNLRITLSCQTPGDVLPQWDLAVNHIRARADHRCLFTDEDEFRVTPSTLENITLWLGRGLADISPGPGGHWWTLEIVETETTACELHFHDQSLRLKQKVGNLGLTFGGARDGVSGLVLSRELAPRIVAEIFPHFADARTDQAAWLLELFNQLRADLPTLLELTVDLGRQKSLRIALP